MQRRHSHFSGILDAIGWNSFSSNHSGTSRLVGFTSCVTRRGVSMVASQVAVDAAMSSEDRVLAVDCNFSHPTLHTLLGCELSPGYSDAIQSVEQVDLAIKATQIPNLFVMPSGNCLERGWGNERSTRRLFQILRNDYELVIFDVPSIGSQPHSISTLSMLDRVFLIHSPSDSAGSLEAGYAMLECQGVIVSGTILNQLPPGKASQE